MVLSLAVAEAVEAVVQLQKTTLSVIQNSLMVEAAAVALLMVVAVAAVAAMDLMVVGVQVQMLQLVLVAVAAAVTKVKITTNPVETLVEVVVALGDLRGTEAMAAVQHRGAMEAAFVEVVLGARQEQPMLVKK